MQYVMSATLKADPRSHCDKFWAWLSQMHNSAIQASLMQLCDKSSAVKTSSGYSLRCGVTCNICGGRGHYARECASKGKSAGTAKVNVAITRSLLGMNTINTV